MECVCTRGGRGTQWVGWGGAGQHWQLSLHQFSLLPGPSSNPFSLKGDQDLLDFQEILNEASEILENLGFSPFDKPSMTLSSWIFSLYILSFLKILTIIIVFYDFIGQKSLGPGITPTRIQLYTILRIFATVGKLLFTPLFIDLLKSNESTCFTRMLRTC